MGRRKDDELIGLRISVYLRVSPRQPGRQSMRSVWRNSQGNIY